MKKINLDVFLHCFFILLIFGIILARIHTSPTKPSIDQRVTTLERQINVIQVMLFEKENKQK
jgi:hypothetical protein